MQRKEFITTSCQTCLLLAAGWIMPALTGCSPSAYQVFNTDVQDDRILVPADTISKAPLLLIRPKGWYYSIALRKRSDGSYTALLLKCTHQDNQLTASTSGYNCSLHGSAFSPEGVVVKGPAELPLKSFPVVIENNFLIIHTKAQS